MALDAIQDIINNCVKADTTKPTIELIEKENVGKAGFLSKVVIEKAHDSVWFSVDRNKNWSPYLNEGGFQKRCDYVIMKEVQGAIQIIFIELKSSNIKKEEIIEKFKATECFMDYCGSIAKRFFNKPITSDCQKRFVVFYLNPLAKKPTRQCPSLHDSPENARYIANPSRTKLRQLLR